MPCPCPGRSIRVFAVRDIGVQAAVPGNKKSLDMPLSNQSLLEIRDARRGLSFRLYTTGETKNPLFSKPQIIRRAEIDVLRPARPRKTPVLSIWTALP